MGLASGEESCDCRQQNGQWASSLLNKDGDCGSQGEDVEDVDVVVFPFRAPVSKVQELKGEECTVGREISSGGKVTKEVCAFPPVVSLPVSESLLQKLQRRHRRDLSVPQATQVARIKLRSCAEALKAEGSGPY